MDKFFITSDGVRLHYRVSGEGIPLVILPGLSQDTTKFEKNYDAFNKHFTVYALDYRGHGQSDTPEYGYHIERLTKDFQELLEHCELDKVYLLAHSMGNALSWCYFSLFGQDRIIKYILEDEAPCLICDPEWTETEKEMYTGLIHRRDVWETAGTPPADPTLRGKMRTRLLRDHLGRDWRDIIPTIKIPTLVLTGGASFCNGTPLVGNWLHENIKGSKLEVITKEENGTHDMHITSPDRFNQIVLDFFVSAEAK